ncbi:unnamed protein product [Rhodiola kirilowii]
MILESMSKNDFVTQHDKIIQLLTEMKNENSVYMSNLSKLKSQVSSISNSSSSVHKVEESDQDCGVPAADVVSTDDANFESAPVAILEDLGNPKSDEMNSEVVVQCLNLELHKKISETSEPHQARPSLAHAACRVLQARPSPTKLARVHLKNQISREKIERVSRETKTKDSKGGSSIEDGKY